LVGAIGPVTTRKLRQIGIPPNVMPATFLIVEALKALVSTYEAANPRHELA